MRLFIWVLFIGTLATGCISISKPSPKTTGNLEKEELAQLWLQEGQELHPTVYMTWDDRTLIVETPPLILEFLTDTETEPAAPDLPLDYRSAAPDLDG